MKTLDYREVVVDIQSAPYGVADCYLIVDAEAWYVVEDVNLCEDDARAMLEHWIDPFSPPIAMWTGTIERFETEQDATSRFERLNFSIR